MPVSSVALLLILLLSTLTLPGPVRADDIKQLNNEENTYVASINAALDRAIAVTSQVDEIAAGGLIESIFIKSEESSGRLATLLEGADISLAACAGVLLEDPPSSMTTIAGSYVGTAEIFEAGYSACRAIVVEEGENAALEWGRDVLGDIYGMGGDGGAGGLAATARIKGCIASRSNAISEAARGARQLLESKVAEVQENREPEVAKNLPYVGDVSCFIATAAYGTSSAVQIDVLRDFRDQVLAKSQAGRDYIDFYYTASPPIADFIAQHEWLRTMVRELVVDPIVFVADATRPLWS